MASAGVLQGLCYFVQYYVLGAQLFLHPHSVPHRQHSPDYKCFLFDLIAYRTRRTVCLNPYRNHGNQGAIQSLSRWQIFSSNLCTAECGTLSVAVRLFMSSALRRAVNAERTANCYRSLCRNTAMSRLNVQLDILYKMDITTRRAVHWYISKRYKVRSGKAHPRTGHEGPERE